MIIGCLTTDRSPSVPGYTERLAEITGTEDLVYHAVEFYGFKGGYFLNKRLPYTHSDFIYTDESSDIAVLLSGVIYNREELLKTRRINRNIPTPELIALLFLDEGPDFVKRVNGDFALFIHRPVSDNSFLFRDHLGIRPMAYTLSETELIFSSDIMGLSMMFSQNEAIDSEYLLSYFKLIDYSSTPVMRVKKLLPGHYLSFTGSGRSITRYWCPEDTVIDRELSYKRVIDDLGAILHDAIRIRCDSRFNAGAHVTSGLDSGIVSALVRQEYNSQTHFYGFSWSPEENVTEKVKYDERDRVRALCSKNDIMPLFSDMNVNDLARYVTSYYYNLGYYPEAKTVEQASERGVNLLFSGFGGDEFISTGHSGVGTDLLRGLNLKLFLRYNGLRQLKAFPGRMLYHIIFPALGILDRTTARILREDVYYLKRNFKKSDRNTVKNFYFYTSRRQRHLRLLDTYYIPERCESWAINGYHHGVEYRYPLLDRRIVEYMLAIPSAVLAEAGGSRELMRSLGRDILPAEILRHEDKNDPVCWENYRRVVKQYAEKMFDETDRWRENPDLGMIDFSLLQSDIEKLKSGSKGVNVRQLSEAMINIKSINDLTVKLRQ